jgi:hypothetical protein
LSVYLRDLAATPEVAKQATEASTEAEVTA